MSSLEIRPILEADLNDVHALAIQLGYEPSKQNIINALKAMSERPDYENLVITENGEVVGWMTLFVCYRIEEVPYLQLSSIVIKENFRGRGFGKRLIGYAEEQAKNKRLKFVSLNSGTHRLQSQRIYENLGFEKVKESFVFRKLIPITD